MNHSGPFLASLWETLIQSMMHSVMRLQLPRHDMCHTGSSTGSAVNVHACQCIAEALPSSRMGGHSCQNRTPVKFLRAEHSHWTEARFSGLIPSEPATLRRASKQAHRQSYYSRRGTCVVLQIERNRPCHKGRCLGCARAKFCGCVAGGAGGLDVGSWRPDFHACAVVRSSSWRYPQPLILHVNGSHSSRQRLPAIAPCSC